MPGGVLRFPPKASQSEIDGRRALLAALVTAARVVAAEIREAEQSRGAGRRSRSRAATS